MTFSAEIKPTWKSTQNRQRP